MRNLSPRRRAAAIAACCAAILPSVVLLTRTNARAADHTATFVGMATGVVVGISILLLRKSKKAC